MSPLGRRPLQRGVFSFEDQEIAIPERVVVDTSFVLEALLVSQPLHAPCQKFLIELASAGSALFFSRLLDVELAEAAFQLALKERHPKDWRRFRHDGRARPRAAKLMRDVAGASEDVLDAVPFRRFALFVHLRTIVREAIEELLGQHRGARRDSARTSGP